MAKLVFGLNQSLDGYVDHKVMPPEPGLFRHFIEHVRGLTGLVYGRRMYEVMRYWDEDLPDWDAEERSHSEGFSHFVTSMTAPVASGWSGCRVGLTPTGKRRLVTAHTQSGPDASAWAVKRVA
jgi:hypothetical protein